MSNSSNKSSPLIVFVALLTAMLTSSIIPLFAVGNSVAETPLSSSGGSPSDFNGDGYEDLAVGAPLEDIGSKTDAGAVHVFCS
ncbi:MAG TPA: FG-GAP repeat protein [Nitrososphaera sp.]|nr:FG-GAP repeat protein [Nitrososphaera sp.]